MRWLLDDSDIYGDGGGFHETMRDLSGQKPIMFYPRLHSSWSESEYN